MKKTITLLAGMLLAAASASADTAGSSYLSAMSQKISSMPAITCDFTLEEGGNKVAGSVISSGNCFIITAADDGYQSWFDGKTQWTWTSATGEVNMSEPTPDELLETNPFAIIAAIKDNYTASVVKSNSSAATLRLLPKDPKKGNIKEAEVDLNTTTNIPTLLVVKLKDGQVVKIAFSKVKSADRIPTKEFRYKTSYHPEAEIIDLR